MDRLLILTQSEHETAQAAQRVTELQKQSENRTMVFNFNENKFFHEIMTSDEHSALATPLPTATWKLLSSNPCNVSSKMPHHDEISSLLRKQRAKRWRRGTSSRLQSEQILASRKERLAFGTMLTDPPTKGRKRWQGELKE